MDVGGGSLPASINPNNFPAKLWRLVNSQDNKAISWDNLGEVIIIDQQLFEKQILSSSPNSTDNADGFKTTNFSSFVRQLNLYGFRKADPPVKDSHRCSGDRGVYHHFYNPNFKRNHPELVASLRRLTVDNKAKLQAGLSVTCRPPSRYQRLSGDVDGRDTNGKKGNFSLLSPKHLESTHPYYPTKSQAMTAHSGTPVPPRYLMRGHQHLSPSVFATDQGIQVSLSQHYNGGAPGSGAVHIQQSLLPSANHGNPNVTNLNSCSTQYHQGYYSPVCHCYHSNLVAGSGLQAGLFSPQSYYQIADEVMQTPSSNCLVKAVTPEKRGPVLELSSNNCSSMLCDSPVSTVKANPLCTTPIIMAVSGNVDLVTCRQQEESVVSVPEQMPEDAISEVTSDEARDTDVMHVKVSDILMDPIQVYSSSCTRSTASL
uniref:HSF-type DNA-binding domain-containing protein n=1 Tax=Anabas testudineus TaxID=64144 RepID=A0A7N6AQU4_ANATE